MKLQKNLLRLKRYFLGKTVVIPQSDGSKIKLKTIDSSWASNNYNFRKSKSNFYNNYNTTGNHPYNRQYMFREYNLMERDPIIARSLDILSDGACQKNEYNETVIIKCDDDNIKITLEHLFYEIMGLNFSLRNYTRGMLKYGDFYLYLNLQEKVGVVDVIPLSSIDVERIENEETGNTTFKVAGIFNDELDEENIAHFRNGKNIELYPYGVSILEPIRRYWKMLSLLEDFMMVYYLLRSVNPRVFRIDVGNLSRDGAMNYIETYKQMFKKRPLQDNESGEYDLYYDPISNIEDIYLPVRPGYDNTTFDEIPAGSETSIVEGIEYLRRKMMSGLGVPNFLLNYEEQINSRSVASGEDIRLGSFIESIQELLIDELTRIAIIHLILQGYESKDLYSFEIELTPPSDLKEMEGLDKIEKRINTATTALQSEFYSKDWIYENILNHGEDELKEIKEQILQDIINEKLNEEYVANVDFDISKNDDDDMEDMDNDTTPSEGAGSEGGQLPDSTPDSEQLDSPTSRAEDLLSARDTSDPSRRTTTPEDRDV